MVLPQGEEFKDITHPISHWRLAESMYHIFKFNDLTCPSTSKLGLCGIVTECYLQALIYLIFHDSAWRLSKLMNIWPSRCLINYNKFSTWMAANASVISTHGMSSYVCRRIWTPTNNLFYNSGKYNWPKRKIMHLGGGLLVHSGWTTQRMPIYWPLAISLTKVVWSPNNNVLPSRKSSTVTGKWNGPKGRHT